MNKILILLISILFLSVANIAHAAPKYDFSRTILPDITDRYELGTTSLDGTTPYRWLNAFIKNGFFENITVTGTCTGCGGGGGGGSSTSTNPLMATYFVATSTTASSTLPIVESTWFKLGSNFFNNLLGSGLKNVNGALTASTTVDNIYINVKDYGAVGDGVTDDTAAINRALSVQQNASTTAILFFPAGVYPMSQTIAPTNRLYMEGVAGATGSLQSNKTVFLSRILHTGDNQPIITLSEEGDRIENLDLQFSTFQDYTKTNAIGIKFGDGAMGARIHNIGMTNVAYGFYSGFGIQSWQHDISNIRIDTFSISCFSHFASNTSTTINQFYCQNLPPGQDVATISAVSKVADTITFTVDHIPANMKIGRQIYVTGLAPAYLNTIFFVNATTSTSIDVLATSSDPVIVTDPNGAAGVPGQPILGPAFDIAGGVWNIQGLDIEHFQATSSAIVQFNTSMVNINDVHFENVYWNTNAFNILLRNSDGIVNVGVMENINSGCTQYQTCYIFYNNNVRSQMKVGLYQTRDFSSKFATSYKGGSAGATASYTVLGDWNQQTSFRAGSDPTPTDFAAIARVLTGKFSTTTADTDTYIYGKLGVGTTSPYAPLSVVGQAVAEYFTATSTSIASFFPYASTTAITALDAFITRMNITNLTATNSTTTNATTTNLYATTASTSVLYANSIGIGTSSTALASLDISRADANNIFYFARTGVSSVALDFISGRNNLKLTNGRLNIAESTITDGTAKSMHITMPNYDALSSGVNCVIVGSANLSSNVLNIGGGSTTCFPATQLAFTTGTSSKVVDSGNTAMFIEGQSRIGMGTLFPTSKVHIVGLSTTTSDVLNVASSTGTSQFIVKYDGKVGIGTSTPGAILDVYDAQDGPGQYDRLVFDPVTNSLTNRRLAITHQIQNALNIDSLIDSSGLGADLALQAAGGSRLGVGTSSPSDKLHVYDASDSAITLGRAGTPSSIAQWLYNGSVMQFGTQASDNVGIISGGNQRVTVSSAGLVGIGTTSPASILDVTDPSDASGINDRLLVDFSTGGFTNRTLTVDRPTQETVGIRAFITNSGVPSDIAFQLSGGNIGIGTTSPYAKLSVVGQIVGEYMTATSTTATSTFPLLSTNAISINGNYITNLWATSSSNFWLLSTSSVGTINTMSGLASIGSSTGTTTLQGATILNGLVGIGTTSPTSLVDIYDVTDGGGQYDEVSIDPVTGGFTNRWLKFTRPNQTAWGIDSIIKSNGVGADLVLQSNGGGNLGVGSSTPSTKLVVAGTTTVQTLVSTSTATSSFGGGVNLTSGCYAFNNTCISSGGGGGSGTVNSGTQGQAAYYAANGTAVSGTSTLFIADNTNVGISSSTPWATFAVNPVAGAASNQFVVGSSTGTSFIINNSGNVGIGTTTPFATLAVNPVAGQAQNQFVVGSSTKTNFIVTNTGNVGIGTANPTYALDVTSGTAISNIIRVNASSGNGNSSFAANRTLTSNSSSVQFSTAGTSDWLIGMPYGTLTTSGSDFNIIDGSNNVRFLINKTTGFVGVGTTTPAYKLDSWGDIAAQNISSSNITMRLLRGGTEYGAMYSLATDSNFYLRATQSSGALNLQTGGPNTRMTIDNSGNVGIGTTTPSQKLQVSGQSSLPASSGSTQTGIMRLSANGVSPALTATMDFGVYNTTGAGWIQSGNLTSLGTNYALLLNPNGGNVGIGTSTPNGKLNVWTGQAGAYTPNTSADDFVIENNASAGLSIVTPDVSTGNIYFGSPSRAIGGMMRWNYSGNLFTIGTGNTSGQVSILSGNSVEAMRIDGNGLIGIGTTSPYAKLAVVGQVVGQYFTATSTTATSTFPLLLSTNSTSTNLRSSYGLFGDAYPLYTDSSVKLEAWGDTNGAVQMGIGNRNAGTAAYNCFFQNNDRATSAVLDYVATCLNSGRYTDTTFGTGMAAPSQWSVENTMGQAAFFLSSTTATNGALDIYTQGKNNENLKARLTYAGNFGIGTGTPLARLSVDMSSTSSSVPAFVVGSSTRTALTVDGANGNVGVGTSTPFARLSVDTTSLGSAVPSFVVGSSTKTDLRVDQGGSIFAPNLTISTAGNAVCRLTTGELVDSGATTCPTSSQYVKDITGEITPEVAKYIVERMKGVTFNYKGDTEEHYGFTAEQAAQVDKEVLEKFGVRAHIAEYAKYDYTEANTGHEFKKGEPNSVNYAMYTAVLTVAMQNKDGATSSESQGAKWPYVIAIGLLGVWNLALTLKKK